MYGCTDKREPSHDIVSPEHSVGITTSHSLLATSVNHTRYCDDRQLLHQVVDFFDANIWYNILEKTDLDLLSLSLQDIIQSGTNHY